MTSEWDRLFGTGTVVVDGGLSTQLEAMGRDTSGLLWTGRVLLEDPEAIQQAHAAYVRSGADVVISASYQVSRWGFEQLGLGADAADAALRASTAAARAAVGGTGVRVAASVGPYGAVLHDGSEYRGAYGLSVADLAAFHRQRLDVLVGSRPDLLAVETIPDVIEAEALVEVLADHPDLPAWVTFSAKDGGHVCAGQPIEDAVAVAASAPSVMAVGVNCTDPQHVTSLVERIRAVTDLAIVVYPNAGGQWDAADGEWHGAGERADASSGGSATFPAVLVEAWRQSGATAIGGCCGTDARSISGLARQLAASAG